MWFRPGNGQSVDFDKFRVSSFKRRIRGGRKTPEKSSSTESENILIVPPTTKTLSKTDSVQTSSATTKNDENVRDEQSPPQPPPPTLQQPQIPPRRRWHRKSSSTGTPSVVAGKDAPSSSLHSSLSRRISRSFGDKEKEPEKEKVLLTDRKFKNNRVEKSSSKGKGLNDLDKRESMKGRRGDSRKISAPPILDNKAATAAAANLTKSAGLLSPAIAVVKKNSRTHSNLNLNALYKLVGSSSRKLSSEDFERIRRKSLSEAAAPVIAVATSKQLPNTSSEMNNKENSKDVDNNEADGSGGVGRKGHNEGQNNGIINREYDDEIIASHKRNGCLETIQTLQNGVHNLHDNKNEKNNNDDDDVDNYVDDVDNVNNERMLLVNVNNGQHNDGKNNDYDNDIDLKIDAKCNKKQINKENDYSKYENEDICSSSSSQNQMTKCNKVMNNEVNDGSNSCCIGNEGNGKSAGGGDGISGDGTNADSSSVIVVAGAKNTNKKISSPSLTSRVAAKISETTNNYKNRKSKTTPKKRKSSRRPELYKQISIDRPHSTSVVRQPSDRRPDLASTSFSSSGTASQNTSDLTTPSHGSFDTDSNALVATENDSKRDRSKSKSAPVSVNRSESYKERLSHKRNRTNRRKTSDPSLSKTNDEQSELGLSNANYTASSSSSLSSSSLESPSTSLEQVGGPQPTIPPGGQSQTGLSGPGPGSGGSASFQSNAMITTATGTVQTPRQWVDSEDETDFTEIDWSSNLSTEVLASLSDAEKKRQEIINEIYQTERNHVRTLKLLEGLFLRPLQESGVLSNDHLQILFPPALFSLKELHSAFEQKLKHRRIEHGYIVRNVGDLLLEMFDGHSGDELRDYSAQFCLRQQIALESLKEKRRKDENLQRLLTKAESHKACRRLQLKDLLPTVMQRLTKYPLLFENLLKITKRVVPDNQNESDSIQKALDSSKQILSDVNQAVKIVEDAHKLQTIQRKLDKSGLDKDEFRNLDLTQYKLIHDGQLTMKKIPGVQLHGLLFENMMVLLHKQDDKYFLKYFPNLAAKTDENNKFISPITHFGQQTLVRQSAVDKNAFFLIITKTSQMLELRAPSSSECKKWFKHISDAAEQYKPRSKSSHDVVEDPASATLPHSNTKESLESTPERTTTTTATATTTTVAAAPQSNASATPSTGSTDNGIPNSHPNSHNQIKDRNDSFSNARNKIDDVNNRILTGTPAGADKFSGGVNGQIVTNASSRKSNSINDERDKHHEGLRPDHDDNGRRDSVYSNNSNDTRTLMQMCPLLEPSEIQISISPAPVAEPVVTPAERLKQLDQMIRERLAEKQKIICDMFRVPNEHFSEIADVAAQPEAPKDSADIALAAFAQVQSLIEVLNDHMKVTTVQEISAVSTAVCDQCHYRNIRTESSPMVSSIGSTNTGTTVVTNSELNQSNQSNNNTSGSGNGVMKDTSLDDTIIQEDDGYCEIDELRLPSVPNPLSSSLTTAIVNGLQQPQQQHKFAGPLTPVPPTPPPPQPPSVHISSSTPELIKRQSTISADSIPEETEQDITNDEQTSNSKSSVVSRADDESTSAVQSEATTSTDDQQLKGGLDDSLNNSEHMEINETYDSVTNTINKPQIPTPNQTQNTFGHFDLCGPNRLSHVQSLEPSVPCHLINGIVTTLGSQISLLLPKINERETERERLRRENQRLRELLNSMHENRRVAEEMETPDITESAKKDEKLIDQDNINQETSSAPSTTVVSSSTVTSAAATTATTASVEKEN